MRRERSVWIWGLRFSVCLLTLVLAACAGRRHSPPSITGGPKAANLKPYQIHGVWYYPRVQWRYDKTGIASWYGPDFHGKLTADGEVYNMNALTAAHKTLQLPVNVRVTNLGNGRSLILRVNDRGPFVNGRIIDVSRRAAQLLGFSNKGTAKVRVQVVDAQGHAGGVTVPQPRISEEEKRAVKAAPLGVVSVQPLAPPSGARGRAARAPPVRTVSAPGVAAQTAAGQGVLLPLPQSVVVQGPVSPSNIYIQAGAFMQPGNAHRLASRLSRYGRPMVTRAQIDQQWFYRVRIGPIDDANKAQATLDMMISNGEKDARIVVE